MARLRHSFFWVCESYQDKDKNPFRVTFTFSNEMAFSLSFIICKCDYSWEILNKIHQIERLLE